MDDEDTSEQTWKEKKMNDLPDSLKKLTIDQSKICDDLCALPLSNLSLSYSSPVNKKCSYFKTNFLLHHHKPKHQKKDSSLLLSLNRLRTTAGGPTVSGGTSSSSSLSSHHHLVTGPLKKRLLIHSPKLKLRTIDTKLMFGSLKKPTASSENKKDVSVNGVSGVPPSPMATPSPPGVIVAATASRLSDGGIQTAAVSAHQRPAYLSESMFYTPPGVDSNSFESFSSKTNECDRLSVNMRFREKNFQEARTQLPPQHGRRRRRATDDEEEDDEEADEGSDALPMVRRARVPLQPSRLPNVSSIGLGTLRPSSCSLVSSCSSSPACLLSLTSPPSASCSSSVQCPGASSSLHCEESGSSSSTSTVDTSVQKLNQQQPCAIQARIYDDTSMSELTSYFDLYCHIPKKMSHMAEMMYI